MYSFLFGNENSKNSPEADNKLDDSELIQTAITVGPRVYRIKRKTTGPLRILTLGCQGAEDAQKKVAEYMNRHAKDNPPDLILILGDNFYDYGVDTAFAQEFTTKFTDVYGNPKLTHIANIPCFVILGNHDENLHSLGMFKKEKGVERGAHEVAHSYIRENKYSVNDKKNLYSQDTLDITDLPTWNMPYRYYSLIDDQSNTQIFNIDSNTYVHDFLNSAYTHNERNQAIWLAEEMKKAKAAGRRTIIALHHPPFTPGKRAYEPNDMKFYLREDEIKVAKEKLGTFNDRDAYNVLIQKTLEKQGLQFDVFLTAHDHAMYYYNNSNDYRSYPICQITSGGGGGSLQDRRSFAEQKNMGCYLKEHGFTEVICPLNPKAPVLFNMHTTKETHLQFDSTKSTPIQHYPASKNEQNDIHKFHAVITNALNDYFKFLDKNQTENKGGFYTSNLTHGSYGADRAHKAWSCLSQPVIKSYKELVLAIHEVTKRQSTELSPSDHSLITLINNGIKLQYQDEKILTMDELKESVLKRNQFEIELN